jgi:hypothetical protein
MSLHSIFNALVFGPGKEKSFGIESIDSFGEHTPTTSEYDQLKENKAYKRIVQRIGGFSKVQRVKCGEKSMEFNLKHVKEFLASEEGQDYRRESGWCLLVGAPTGCLFLPFFWVVEKQNPDKWKSISGFPDEKHMILCTSRNFHEQFASIEDNVFKAVAWAPINMPGMEMQQSIENFENTGVFGSVSQMILGFK